MKYISLPVFIISFTVGLFITYILGTDKRTVYVYPTPDNSDKIQYKDSSDQCFKYRLTKIDCPMNPLGIKKIPVQ